jgi:hypothetical protein
MPSAVKREPTSALWCGPPAAHIMDALAAQLLALGGASVQSPTFAFAKGSPCLL